MHTWVCGIFGENFEAKKALCTSRLVLAFWSHGLTGFKLGSLWIRFPVWRELKQEELLLQEWRPPAGFGYAFPFEGNWNRIGTEQLQLFVCFGYAFPFEGNWNMQRQYYKTIDDLQLWIRFPVWRELKPFSSRWSSSSRWSFGYAFPFEGNWNP